MVFLAHAEICYHHYSHHMEKFRKQHITRMWGDAQRDGRTAEYRWCPLLNTAKFG